MLFAILIVLLFFFAPFILSLFGRPLFILASFLCCCAMLWIAGIGMSNGLQPLIQMLLWIAGWIAAAIGLATKREHQRRVSLKHAIRELYIASLSERHRQTMRGKNRATQ